MALIQLVENGVTTILPTCAVMTLFTTRTHQVYKIAILVYWLLIPYADIPTGCLVDHNSTQGEIVICGSIFFIIFLFDLFELSQKQYAIARATFVAMTLYTVRHATGLYLTLLFYCSWLFDLIRQPTHAPMELMVLFCVVRMITFADWYATMLAIMHASTILSSGSFKVQQTPNHIHNLT